MIIALHSLVLQVLQFALALALAPGLTGTVRWIKARLLGRRGPSPLQPYRDLLRLLRKETVRAETASPLYDAPPVACFVLCWLAAGLVPGFTLDLALAGTADLIALIAILAAARFALVLAGLDVGTAFGGIGASREMMIASLAEPAMLLVTFTVALFIHSTSIPEIAGVVLTEPVGLRVSFGLALVALTMVAIAETGRIPVDNPATHLELTMVHEAMVLEYSGRDLALIEAAAMLKLLFFLTLIAALFAPWGLAFAEASLLELLGGIVAWIIKLGCGAVFLAVAETAIAKMRVFRVAEFLGGAFLLGLLGVIFLYVSQNF